MIDVLDIAQQANAAARWMTFVGLPIASGVRVTFESVFGTLHRHGLPWFVDSLAKLEPVVLVIDGCPTYRPELGERTRLWVDATGKRFSEQTERALVMQQAISSVLVCLRHVFATPPTEHSESVVFADHSLTADLLIERGHAWLGEPLAIWLRGGVGDHDLAVRLLIERVPVLPEFAEWARVDAARHNVAGLTYSVAIDGVTQTVTFEQDNATTAEIVQAINEQLTGVTARADGDLVVLTAEQVEASFIVETETEEPRRERGSNGRGRGQTNWQERASGRRNRWRTR